MGGITIEREYLYWTNKYVPIDFPAVSKAFTEPFIKQVPLQTFSVVSPNGTHQIVANSAFLFFTDEYRHLLAMNKHGYTTVYFDTLLPLQSQPTALFAYRDECLLVATREGLAYLDTRELRFDTRPGQDHPVPPLQTGWLLKSLPNG